MRISLACTLPLSLDLRSKRLFFRYQDQLPQDLLIANFRVALSLFIKARPGAQPFT